ncbi:hypothetical protein N9L01_00020 [bacterium]|nr:hypothetical protein [bacterium]
MASNYGDKQRDIKRRYRKESFQTGYDQAGESVDATPLPYHSYSTSTHTQTQPARPGLDARTYQRDVRPAVESLESLRPLNQANYPWHLVPLGDAANVIQRQRVNLSSLTGGSLQAGYWVDAVVLNVSFESGSDTWVGGVAEPVQSSVTPPSHPPALFFKTTDAIDTKQASQMRFPTGSGSTFTPETGVTAVATPASILEYYKIRSFGHTEPDGATDPTDSLQYQIWIDGVLFMTWTGFQWSAVTPQRDQWFFEQPLTVERQIVFRIINPATSGADASGNVEASFVGWSEQMTGYFDISHQQLQSV